MEQHPIPQQISSYEFKLVGDMTLKQFLKAATGIVLALLVRSSGLIVLVKWPLIFLLAGGGLVLAFIPFRDRPLETWIISFFKSIYSPTIYLYKKKADESWLETDLTKINSSKSLVSKKAENGEEEKISNNLSLKDFFQVSSLKKSKKKNEEDEVVSDNKVKENKSEVREKVLIDKSKEVVINKSEEKENGKSDWRKKTSNLGLKSEKLKATGRAVFGEIPMPDMPEVANVAVGMATNNEGKIIDGVIVEIQDEKGNPSRVLKTNSLGQFKVSTPLANGRYLIIAEKEGYTFDRVNLDLTGKIVEPIKIIAHN